MNPIKIYKKRGLTPLQALEEYRKSADIADGVPMTYAGRLDPLAEGLLLILTGEDCKHKDELTSLPKIYEIEILLGFGTDTYDLLGMLDCVSNMVIDKTQIKTTLKNIVGPWDQPYPPYSSKAVGGKPLHFYARNGNIDSIDIPTKTIDIKSITLNNIGNISTPTLRQEISSRIDSVTGDFRQKEIKNKWLQELGQMEDKNHPLLSLTVSCSSGTYMRALAHKIGQELRGCALAFKIKRTKIGPYGLP